MRKKVKLEDRLYSLYKGDKYLTSGTIEEIAKERNRSPNTIRHYLFPVYERRAGANGLKLIDITDYGDEEE